MPVDECWDAEPFHLEAIERAAAKVVATACYLCASLPTPAKAISEKHRQEQEAKLGELLLAAERSECSLIWHLENSNGEVLDFRGTASPQAVLGVRLTSQPRAEPQHGSSEGYSWDLRR